MNLGKKVRKITSMALVLIMACSSVVFGQGFDYEGHWAENSIKSWVDKGYAKGYDDGNFKPDNEITRAEFVSLVNRSFEFTTGVAISYTDVAETHWAYTEFERANAAGYIAGFEDGTLRPSHEITRQEVAAIISRLLDLEAAPTSEKLIALDDASQIPGWSKGVVGAVVDKGYMNLRDDNSFAPTLPATRAEVVSALDNALSSIVNIVEVTYSEVSIDDDSQPATKGTLAVSLSAVPTTTPTAMSIDITRTIDGEQDDDFNWEDATVTWDALTKVLTISGIELIEAIEEEQIVVYTVSYEDTVRAKSEDVIIEAKK